MTIASFEGKTPHIGAGTYIHPSTDVFGDVTIGEGCRVGRVRYTGKVTVHPEAEVESPPEKVGSLTD